MVKKILRVGVLNNFNHTDAEIVHANQLGKKWNVFVNSNAKTPIRFGPAVVTINPDLDKFIEPSGDITKISAVRIKVVADPKLSVDKAMTDAYTWASTKGIPVLLTAMRFTSEDMMKQYTKSPKLYKWDKNYYRLKEWSDITVPAGAFFCDEKHLGCPTCKNCAKLTYNEPDAEIYGINLSESGKCPFNCPGCFAKKCLAMTKTKTPLYDKPFQNKKQKGAM